MMSKDTPKSQKEKPQTDKHRRNANTANSSRKIKLDSTQDGTEKRRRSSNFHIKEIEDLLNFIDSEKSIIECKRTDQLTNSRKDKTWKGISQIFNTNNATKRSDKQLRSKWETLKKIARKEYISGSPSAVSNIVLKIMLSCNESDFKYNPDVSVGFKEEPNFESTMEEISIEDSDQGNQLADLTGSQPSIIRTARTENSKKEMKASSAVEESRYDDLDLTNNRSQDPNINSTIMQVSSELLPSEDRLQTKSTQYEIQDLWPQKRNKLHYQNIGRVLFREENKRKREKHRLEMEILRVELALKKRQLECLCD